MQEVFREKQAVVARVSAIVENLFKTNNLFQERLNKNEMIQLLANLFE